LRLVLRRGFSLRFGVGAGGGTHGRLSVENSPTPFAWPRRSGGRWRRNMQHIIAPPRSARGVTPCLGWLRCCAHSDQGARFHARTRLDHGSCMPTCRRSMHADARLG
jgi:hypothetical protein